MSKIHVILSYVVVLLVAVVSAIIELPVKIAAFTILAVIYLFALLTAPLFRKVNWSLDKLIDYAFSFEFVFASFMVNKYRDALDV